MQIWKTGLYYDLRFFGFLEIKKQIFIVFLKFWEIPVWKQAFFYCDSLEKENPIVW